MKIPPLLPVVSGLTLSFLFCLPLRGAVVENLPGSFYRRPGLEHMPRIDYSGMKVVNVRDCGAKGDGRTDEKAAFERAIRDLQPGGGIVWIPRGRYYFAPARPPERKAWSPRLGLKPLENIHFVGEGDESEIVFRHEVTEVDSVFYGWDFDGAKNLSLRDLRFRVEPLLQMRWHPGIGLTPISLGGAVDGVQLLRVSTDQGRMGFVSWKEGKDIWIVESDFRNTSADAVHVRNGNGVTVAYSHIENSGDDGIALWMATGKEPIDYAKWGKNYRALFNTVIGTRWGRGIAVSGENIEVIGNWVEESVFAGIGVMDHDNDPMPPSRNVLLEDNTVIRSGLGVRPDNNLVGHDVGGGIVIAMNTALVRVINNRILSGQNEGLGLGHPFPLKSESVEIEGNQILGNLGVGLRVQPQRDSRIERLVFRNNVLSGNAAGAVRFDAGKIGVSEPADLAAINQTDAPLPDDPFAAMRTAPGETTWDLGKIAFPADLPEINVRDHGAIGDGVANDLPAFVRALSEAPDSGAVLRVPAGRYLLVPLAEEERSPETALRQHLLIRGAKNLRIVGEGGASELIFSSRNHQGLRLLNGENCSVENLALRHAGEGGGRRGRALLDLAASSGIRLENVAISHAGGAGVLVDSCRQIVVENCIVNQAANEGIRVVSSRQVDIRGCTLTDSTDHGILVFWDGSICREPQFVRVTGNTIAGTTQGAGIGIASGNEIEVTRNTITRGGLTGIALYEQSRFFSPRRIVIAENMIRQSPGNPLSYVKGAVGIYKCFGGKEGASDFSIVKNQIALPNGTGIWISNNRPQKEQRPYAIKSLVIEGNGFEARTGVDVQRSLIEKLAVKGNTFVGVPGEMLQMNDAQRGGVREFISE
jgi:hypothetical protein